MQSQPDARICYRCQCSKPPDQFIRRRDGRWYDMCRLCVQEILSRPRQIGARRQKLRHTPAHRTCYLCNRFLPSAQFTRRATGTYFSACKDCNRLVFAQRRRARLLAAEGEFSRSEWDAILEKHPQCPSCKRYWDQIPLPKGRRSVVTVDHIRALSRGGRNDSTNIQPLCYSCNSRKGDRDWHG